MPCNDYKEKFNHFLAQQDVSLASDFFRHIENCSECYSDYKEHTLLEGMVQDIFQSKKQSTKESCSFSADRFGLQLLGSLQESCTKKRKKNSAFINRSLEYLCNFTNNWNISNQSKSKNFKSGYKGKFLAFSISGLTLIALIAFFLPRYRNFRNSNVKNISSIRFQNRNNKRNTTRTSFSMVQQRGNKINSTSMVYSYASYSNKANGSSIRQSSYVRLLKKTHSIPVYGQPEFSVRSAVAAFPVSSFIRLNSKIYPKCLQKINYVSRFSGKVASYYNKKCIKTLYQKYKNTGQNEKLLQLLTIFPSISKR